MADEAGPKRELGIWVRFWDVAIAFVLVVAAFLWIRLDAVVRLRELATEKAWFQANPPVLDAQRNGYAFDTVRDHLRALGEKGRDFYAHDFMPIYDLALSVLLLAFMILFILYATQSDRYHALGLPSWVRKLLLVAPVLQFCFDVGENYLLRSLIEDFPRLDAEIVQRASLMTRLKWLALYVNWLIVAGLGGYTLYQWLAHSPRTNGR
jgi:hypothetical protein